MQVLDGLTQLVDRDVVVDHGYCVPASYGTRQHVVLLGQSCALSGADTPHGGRHTPFWQSAAVDWQLPPAEAQALFVGDDEDDPHAVAATAMAPLMLTASQIRPFTMLRA